MRGEMVVILDGRDWLEPDALKRSIALLRHHEHVDSVGFFGDSQITESMVGLYGAFAELSGRIFGKSLGALGIVRSRLVGHSGIYRAKPLLLASQNTTPLRAIDSRALAASDSMKTHIGKHLRWSDAILRLLFIALVAYGAIAAASLQNPLPLMMMWALVSIWLLAVIWSDSHHRMANKLALSICVPIGMFVIASSYIVSGGLVTLRRSAF